MRNPLAGMVETLRRLETREQQRLTTHAVGLGTVVVAVFLRWLFGVADEPQFWLFSAAIAVSAAFGGTAPALVAALASLLAVRLTTDLPMTSGLLFIAEGLTVALIVAFLRTTIEQERERMSAIEPWMRELKSTERHGRLVESAFSQLDEAADTVVVMLDSSGRISGWRAGATRLYQWATADVIGTSPSPLFDELPEDGFARIILAARQGEAGYTGRQKRADGSTFDAEVRIRPLSRGGFDGFAMIVHDLTDQQAYLQLPGSRCCQPSAVDAPRPDRPVAQLARGQRIRRHAARSAARGHRRRGRRPGVHGEVPAARDLRRQRPAVRARRLPAAAGSAPG
jgi:two-component system, LuxR family, sensor kinase FixL